MENKETVNKNVVDNQKSIYNLCKIGVNKNKLKKLSKYKTKFESNLTTKLRAEVT